ncbi:hypothetical protein Q3G72_017468 [Acer saccharum]|nr:hypothetical protein Q3G72_017468 [Acer saccharum]
MSSLPTADLVSTTDLVSCHRIPAWDFRGFILVGPRLLSREGNPWDPLIIPRGFVPNVLQILSRGGIPVWDSREFSPRVLSSSSTGGLASLSRGLFPEWDFHSFILVGPRLLSRKGNPWDPLIIPRGFVPSVPRLLSRRGIPVSLPESSFQRARRLELAGLLRGFMLPCFAGFFPWRVELLQKPLISDCQVDCFPRGIEGVVIGVFFFL